MTDPQEIKAASVTLSHQQDTAGSRTALSQWLVVALTTAGGFALVIGLLWLAPKLLGTGSATAEQTTIDKTISPNTTAERTPANGSDSAEALPPFAASQRQLARERAQAQLKAFVEKQLELEDAMSVAGWGAQAFDAALDDAAEGDAKFVAEEFEASMTAYSKAVAALDALIETGLARRAQALLTGEQALQARDPGAALTAFAAALLISPKHADALAGQKRATALPKIIEMERTAKNHELAGRWQAAAGVYQEIAKLDPALSGIADRLSDVSRGQKQQEVKAYLSQAFAALETRKYQTARSAFNKALSLDPGNSVALGGLQQVSQETEVGQIGRLERAADAAVAAERWKEAIKQYNSALKVDANAAFAKRGLDQAKQQLAANAVLDQIIESPDKLSSAKLLAQGKEFLAKAQGLQNQGPILQSKIDQVETLLQQYATPVPVELRSDQQTHVLLSTVGKLGRFANKTVQLRPGSYTLIGSRDGCRDVRQELLVRPGMQPVEIRCVDEL